MNGLVTLFHLTVAEARRRRVAGAALLVGVLFLTTFGVGLHFIQADIRGATGPRPEFAIGFVVMAGLYAANFLVVLTAILSAVDLFAGEIGSGVIETLCTKPLRRSTIVLGKWLGGAVLVLCYAALLCGGVLIVGRLVAGYTPPGVARGLTIIALEAVLVMTLALAGGTRLSALANGVVMFGLYGIAFVGGWIETIGTMVGNATARYLGIFASLLMPSEALWQLAAHEMQPPVVRDLGLTPFSTASVPSPAMVWWAVGYVVVVLLFAIRAFDSRDL